jgi:uncharacterized OsmC-like protein
MAEKGMHSPDETQDFAAGGDEQTTRPAPFVLEADEPLILLGDDSAPNATEALLHALSACLSTTFIYHAAARGIEIDELELEMEGSLDVRGVLGLSDEVRNGYEQINVTFSVKSDASPEQISELVELAQARSPVFDIVTHPTPVSVTARKVSTLSSGPTRASI